MSSQICSLYDVPVEVEILSLSQTTVTYPVRMSGIMWELRN